MINLAGGAAAGDPLMPLTVDHAAVAARPVAGAGTQTRTRCWRALSGRCDHLFVDARDFGQLVSIDESCR